MCVHRRHGNNTGSTDTEQTRHGYVTDECELALILKEHQREMQPEDLMVIKVGRDKRKGISPVNGR